MSQHDMIIDNSTGANVRADINNALGAIATNNSGSSAPSTTYASQFFADTNAGIMKLRNTSNNAYVNLFTLGGGIDVDAASTFSEDVTFEGAAANVVFDKSDNALEFADNAKASFGTGADLTLSHNGTDSTVANTTGELVVKGDTLKLKQNTADEVYLVATANGGVDLYHNNVKKLETESGGISLTGGAAANVTALSDGATITVDMATACHHSVTLGGNRTFAAPSNQVVGQSGSIFITQDGTGSRTASFNAAFKFVGGTAPTLTTTAAAVDRIDYIILSSNVIHCAVSLDVK